MAADTLDEYLQMLEDPIILSTKRFCESDIDNLDEKYLRAPTERICGAWYELMLRAGFLSTWNVLTASIGIEIFT